MDTRSLSLIALLCAIVSSCGGGGGGGGGGPAPGASPSAPSPTPTPRGFLFSANYKPGPLTDPTPIFLKTVIGDLNGDGRNDIATFTNSAGRGSDVVVMYQNQIGA